MSGSFYFTLSGPKLRTLRTWTKSPLSRPHVGGRSTFPCKKTGEMVNLIDCMHCEEYKIFDQEDGLRYCRYKYPEQSPYFVLMLLLLGETGKLLFFSCFILPFS